ncbi:MAG: N-formylglutamate amidohydrolase [Methyloceanibacter sp.]|nr:N-formylglutamate amidohydrolase [Methyloceanibacter sp.]MCC0059694.1 N-formylglutamate amidohydrolase [Hyphomicrobiaceae bacterium]
MCRGLEFATLGSIALELSLDTLVQEELGEKPYRTIDGDVKLGLLILCDHAQNRIPEDFHTLGLRPEDLHRHTAFDLGAEGVTRFLAKMLGAPAVISQFSRLLVDPNRGLDDPTLIMEIADGLVVPGNVGLSAAAREERLDRFYRPYDDAVGGMVGAAIDAGRPPVILSIHSFTQAWKGVPRPWHTSVLWDKDPRLPVPLLDGLKTIPDVVVGDNVPYSGQLKGDTLYRHATARGLAHALIEVRQDLILGEQGQAEWAAHLARVVSGVLQSTDGLNTIEYHGSHTGI